MCFSCSRLFLCHTVEIFFSSETVLFQNLKRQRPCPSLAIPKLSLLWPCDSNLAKPSHSFRIQSPLFCRPDHDSVRQTTLCRGSLNKQGFASCGAGCGWAELGTRGAAGGTCRVPGWGRGIPLGFIRKTTPHARTGSRLQLTKTRLSSV